MTKIITQIIWFAFVIAISAASWFGDASRIRSPGSTRGGQVWQLWFLRISSSVVVVYGGVYVIRNIRSEFSKRTSPCVKTRLLVTLNKTHPNRTISIESNAAYELAITVRDESAECFDIHCVLADNLTGKRLDHGRMKLSRVIDEPTCELSDLNSSIRTRILIVQSERPLDHDILVDIECAAFGGKAILEPRD